MSATAGSVGVAKFEKYFGDVVKKYLNPKLTIKETNENIPMGGNQENYRVDCCNADCAWTGYSTNCLRFKHDTGELFCPECHEVVEPVAV